MYYFTGTKQLKYKARADDFYEKNLHSKVLILAALVDPRQVKYLGTVFRLEDLKSPASATARAEFRLEDLNSPVQNGGSKSPGKCYG